MGDTTIYTGKIIRTLDAGRPTAEAVAVRDGLITSVGSVDELSAAGGVVDTRFGEMVILPGFVEAHCPASEETSGISHIVAGSIALVLTESSGPDAVPWMR